MFWIDTRRWDVWVLGACGWVLLHTYILQSVNLYIFLFSNKAIAMSYRFHNIISSRVKPNKVGIRSRLKKQHPAIHKESFVV